MRCSVISSLKTSRAYREARLAEIDVRGVFPLWLRDTTGAVGLLQLSTTT